MDGYLCCGYGDGSMSNKLTPLEKYLQNYEISERSRRIVVHRSHIPKNQGKKRRECGNCNVDVVWTDIYAVAMWDFIKLLVNVINLSLDYNRQLASTAERCGLQQPPPPPSGVF